jgi:hypothetical protein
MKPLRHFSVLAVGCLLTATACSAQADRVGQGATTSPGHAAPSAPPSATRAARPRACTTDELRAAFGGGQLATGNDIGAIDLWNSGPQPCTLAGTPVFTAFLANGTPDAQATSRAGTTLITLTLAAGMTFDHLAADPTGYAVARLFAPERDDPTQPDGLCRSQDEVTPAVFVLSLGTVSLRVPDAGPASLGVKALYGCHGRVILEGVDQASA